MYSLIYTNSINNQSVWCVECIPHKFELNQYLNVVNLDFLGEASRASENFKWVDQPKEVSMSTHIYADGKFVEISSSIQSNTAVSA